jgi:hypothetical protein
MQTKEKQPLGRPPKIAGADQVDQRETRAHAKGLLKECARKLTGLEARYLRKVVDAPLISGRQADIVLELCSTVPLRDWRWEAGLELYRRLNR